MLYMEKNPPRTSLTSAKSQPKVSQKSAQYQSTSASEGEKFHWNILEKKQQPGFTWARLSHKAMLLANDPALGLRFCP